MFSFVPYEIAMKRDFNNFEKYPMRLFSPTFLSDVLWSEIIETSEENVSCSTGIFTLNIKSVPF